ncbi:MAG: type III-B CRISPR module RAMP protein Cmr1 [Acidobacteriota bacterium]
MKRKLPKELEKASESIKADSIKPTNERIHQTRKYKVITPLFGGGIVARENDPSKLIRETSVRGQLRFWWRAMRATGSLKDIYERENFIFGSGGKKAAKSNVSIAVKITSQGQSVDIFRIENRRPKPNDKWLEIAYAAFALQPTTEELKAGGNVPLRKVRVGVEFTLEISYPNEFEADVQAALWAWETFGGIGGRTRRGFGALQLLEIDGKKQSLPDKGKLKEVIAGRLPNNRSVPEGIPFLNKDCRFELLKGNDAISVWGMAIEKYRRFRQYRKDKNTRNLSDYGMSQWPEPAAIKHFALKGGKPSVKAFPRADFGLPIIFHFPQIKGLDDFTLNGCGFERLASPLIIRPIACHNGAAAIAILLKTPRAHEKPLRLTSKDGFSEEVRAKLSPDEARNITENMLDVLKSKTDVLEAFLDYFADTGNSKQGQHGNFRR